MEKLLRWLVDILSRIHDKIMSVNDGREWGLNDKQLHFLVIGAVGIGMFFCVQLVFKWLAKRSVTAISWIYTFTVVLVITFAIEIGQKISGTGNMESKDIFYGVWGFIVAFAGFLTVKGIILLIRRIKYGEPDETPPGVRHFIGDRRGGRSK